jgi:hypothetical protein
MGNHQQEIMNGKPGLYGSSINEVAVHLSLILDTLKGSYYANPVVDKPTVSQALKDAYPEYYGANICKLELRMLWNSIHTI